MTTAPTYDQQDRLLTYGDNTYEYQAGGALERKHVGSSTTVYDYDVFGNLRSVLLPDQTLIEYVIDSRHRRVGKRRSGSLEQVWLYEDQLRPIAELDSSGSIVSRFVYASRRNVPDYMIKGSSTYRILTDHLGSVRLVVDISTGSVAQEIDYDEFGRATLLQGQWDFQPFGFAGGMYDSDTGLVRFGRRDYDAETGRWTAKDPVLFAGGDTNLYGYVLGDPVNFIDPLGLFRDPWEIREDARRDARERFPNQEKDVWQRDAFQHCLASCDAALEYGKLAADILGSLQERATALPTDLGQRFMDDYNNLCGRNAADEAKNRDDCARQCSALLDAGILLTAPVP